MAKSVREVMNRELLCVNEEDDAKEVLLRLLAFAVSGAPVVDASGSVVGVVSWKDLIAKDGKIRDCMSRPALSVASEASIEAAALLLSESGKHRLVVLEGAKPVGVVSTQDVLRALVGLPARHPMSFPHFDPATRLTWSDDRDLREDAVAATPGVEGLVVLTEGGKDAVERVVWVEACRSIRQHLLLLLQDPQQRIPHLAGALRSGVLRFRFAEAADITQRMTGLRTVMQRAREERHTDLGHSQKGGEHAIL